VTFELSDYHRLRFRKPPPLLKGLDAGLNRLVGAYRRRPARLRHLQEEAEAIDRLAPKYLSLSERALTEALFLFRELFRRGGAEAEAALHPSLAAVREMADRKLGLRPFLVQLMGSLALHWGYLAEMATGEGKTLTAGLAGVLAGWTGWPCHIITVNDYLVERDAHWLGPLYRACGVRVGFVTGAMPPERRVHNYACDVTYTTSKEVLADFLRDRLRLGDLDHPSRRLVRQLLVRSAPAGDGLVMRGLHTAFVDEADSVLIDEAVTPLIISTARPNATLKEACHAAFELVTGWQRGREYQVNLRYREVALTATGRELLENQCAGLSGLWRAPGRRQELVKQALVAREFFHNGRQFIVEDGRVVIVDEFTGRPMPQRTWTQGLHQAIEAEAGLEVTEPTETLARLSFQRFFRCYERLAGMTGTAREASAEFWQVYGLPVVSIPTNRPCIRVHHPDRVFVDAESKWQAVVEEIRRLHATGRPVLVGTRSVAASEQLARRLTTHGLDFRVLNATRLAEEASIVAGAGELGRITIATNMAGRGTDIRLGRGVVALGGLHVLATERHESGRVDRQLYGRSARQGDPGSAQAFVSTKDELIARYLAKPLQAWLRQAVARQAPGSSRIAAAAFVRAQARAQRLAFKQRCAVLRVDTWLDESLAFAGSGPAS
jgi:preprotein translocase subunit SecA